MRIIGIDPGLINTGWGIIDTKGDNIFEVANGTCETNSSDNLAVRLRCIFEKLSNVLSKYKPDEAAVENTFVNKDAAGALKLGQARAIALLVPAKLNVPVFEYAPNTIKKAVVGVGHADKVQVKSMVKIQLPKANLDSQDSVDALSIALCHAYQYKNRERLNKAILKAEGR